MNSAGIIELDNKWLAERNSQGTYYIKDYFE